MSVGRDKEGLTGRAWCSVVCCGVVCYVGAVCMCGCLGLVTVCGRKGVHVGSVY